MKQDCNAQPLQTPQAIAAKGDAVAGQIEHELGRDVADGVLMTLMRNHLVAAGNPFSGTVTLLGLLFSVVHALDNDVSEDFNPAESISH